MVEINRLQDDERTAAQVTAQADELAFTGSPTIRIDGTDPFATGQEQVGLACRVYATQAGLGGSPDTAQLLAVLS